MMRLIKTIQAWRDGRQYETPSESRLREPSLPESFPRITLPSPDTLDIAATYLRKEKLEAEREELVREFSGLQMIPALARIMDTVRAAAQYDSSVLVQGETGTGKELVAQAIHFNSARKAEPLMIVNCAAIPERALIWTPASGIWKGQPSRRRSGARTATGRPLPASSASSPIPSASEPRKSWGFRLAWKIPVDIS
jgi:transcriptional regulator with AAA-type ATPase domain